MRHFAFQVAFYVMANVALAFSVEPQTVVVLVVLMVGVPAGGLAWEIARRPSQR